MSDENGAGPAVGGGGVSGEETASAPGLLERQTTDPASVNGDDDDTEVSAVPRVFAKRPPPLFKVRGISPRPDGAHRSHLPPRVPALA